MTKDEARTILAMMASDRHEAEADALLMAIDALSVDGDLISRQDAIEAVRKEYEDAINIGDNGDAIAYDIERILSELPSAENSNAKTQNSNQETQNSNGDLIYRADAIEAVRKCKIQDIRFGNVISNMILVHRAEVIRALTTLPSAEAVQGWRTGKPTENGEYMVTLDAWGHRYIDVMHYAKPLMPNREADGTCWYRDDDELGDVVYDDKDIIAWMPLPKPYKGGDTE